MHLAHDVAMLLACMHISYDAYILICVHGRKKEQKYYTSGRHNGSL